MIECLNTFYVSVQQVGSKIYDELVASLNTFYVNVQHIPSFFSKSSILV
ncbi:TPA: hypothetical protein I9097_001191 [Clostridium perfringens]|nr:hypothetical protein [Clostridium perfringens]